MKILVDCKVVEPGYAGNDQQRLVFAGENWDDPSFCIHGIKLRWLCDDCEVAVRAVGGMRAR